MSAIYRKDLRLYFSSLTTYILLAIFLLSFGILSSSFNLFMGYASLAFPLGYMTFLACVTIPLLSLFSSLRERKSNSEKLFLSLPISPSSIVLGNFFSALTVILIPVLVIALVPFLFFMWGTNALVISEMSVLGYFLLCAFLIALTQFIFSAVKRKWLAITLAFSIPVILYSIHFILSLFYFEGILNIFACLIDPLHYFYALTYGAFDLPSLLYFITLISLFIILNILSLKKKRGGFSAPLLRRGMVIVSLLMIFAVLVLNVGALLIPEKIATVDVSGLNIFRISGKTVDLVRSLDENVKIYYLCKGGAKRADADLHSFLKKYALESDFLKVEIIDTEKNPDFSKAYVTTDLSDQSFLIVGANRSYAVDFNDLYYYENADLNQRFSSQYYNLLLQVYLNYAQTGSANGVDLNTLALAETLFYSKTTSAFFDGENLVTNAIHYVTSNDIPKIYISVGETFSAKDEFLQYFKPEIEKNGFFVKTISSLDVIPNDCDLLLMLSPENDLHATEQSALSQYLNNGGLFYLFSDCDRPELTNLYSIMSEYGLFLEEESNLLCEGNTDKIIVSQYNIFKGTVKSTPITDGKFNGTFAMITPHSILLKETEGVTLTPWITTTDKGYLVHSDSEDDEKTYGTYVCGALAEKDHTRILWLSSPLSVSYTMGQSLSSGGNYSLLLSSFKWITSSQYQSIPFTAYKMTTPAISLNDTEVSVWSLIFIIPFPTATALIGGIRTYVRKKKS